MKSQNVSLQLWHWEEITNLFTLLALLCVTASGALLMAALRFNLWGQASFMDLLAIMGSVSLAMIFLGVASGVHGEHLKRRQDP